MPHAQESSAKRQMWKRLGCPPVSSLFVGLCSCISLACPLTFGMALNALFEDWTTSFGANRGATGAVQATCLGLMSGGGLLAALIERRLGARRTLILGSTLASLGMFSGAFAPSLPVLIATVGVMTGSGFSLIHLSSLSTAMTRFSSHTGFVSSAMSTVTGLFHLGSPLLYRYLSEQYSWRGCLMVVAGLVFQTVMLGVILTTPLLAPSKRSQDLNITRHIPSPSPNHSIVDQLECKDDLNNVKHSLIHSQDLNVTRDIASSTHSYYTSDQFEQNDVKSVKRSLISSQDPNVTHDVQPTSSHCTNNLEHNTDPNNIKCSLIHAQDSNVDHNVISSAPNHCTTNHFESNTDPNNSRCSPIIKSGNADFCPPQNEQMHHFLNRTEMPDKRETASSVDSKGFMKETTSLENGTTSNGDIYKEKTAENESDTCYSQQSKMPLLNTEYETLISDSCHQPHENVPFLKLGESDYSNHSKNLLLDQSKKDPCHKILENTDEISLYILKEDASKFIKEDTEKAPRIKHRSRWIFLKNPLYIFIAANFSFTLSTQISISILVLDLSMSRGWSIDDGIALNFCFMLGSLIGRASVGVASLHKRMNGVILLAITTMTGAVGMAPLGFVRHYHLMAWQLFVVGSSFGSLNGIYPAAVLHVAGTRSYSLAQGLVNSVEGFLDFGFGILTGLIVDQLGTYTVPCLVYGLTSLTLSTILILLFKIGVGRDK